MWNKQTKLGIAFDSLAGFTLDNGVMRAADAACITNERWTQVPVEDRSGFVHICPDFVIELVTNFQLLGLRWMNGLIMAVVWVG